MAFAERLERSRGEAGDVDGTELEGFRQAVLHGLGLPQKSIPSRFLYDERGSEIFEQITEIEEYYPTRAELEIFQTRRDEFAALASDARALIEFGAGSTRKIRALLEAMPFLKIYAPIDISQEFLEAEARALDTDFPDLQVVPIHADFMTDVPLPATVARQPRLAFFPGSTIGNFLPQEAHDFLERVKGVVGAQGMMLIGIDLKKDVPTLIRAYDDRAGVTAAFNLNLLVRINRELGGSFDIAAFRHEARYDADRGRIEMHLVSTRAQTVRVSGTDFSFAEGESIHTENSHKYSLAEFRLLARSAGWEPLHSWCDSANRFSVHLLQA